MKKQVFIKSYNEMMDIIDDLQLKSDDDLINLVYFDKLRLNVVYLDRKIPLSRTIQVERVINQETNEEYWIWMNKKNIPNKTVVILDDYIESEVFDVGSTVEVRNTQRSKWVEREFVGFEQCERPFKCTYSDGKTNRIQAWKYCRKLVEPPVKDSFVIIMKHVNDVFKIKSIEMTKDEFVKFSTSFIEDLEKKNVIENPEISVKFSTIENDSDHGTMTLTKHS